MSRTFSLITSSDVCACTESVMSTAWASTAAPSPASGSRLRDTWSQVPGAGPCTRAIATFCDLSSTIAAAISSRSEGLTRSATDLPRIRSIGVRASASIAWLIHSN